MMEVTGKGRAYIMAFQQASSSTLFNGFNL